MEAFIRAMERRQEAGQPLDRHSVASFFVSRVDTEVDKRLEAAGNTELQGRAGLANARAAYKAFQRVFEGERFATLREAGCPVQRPLWASTGVKNPAYPATLYVWGLVAPHTVNTMPMPTLEAAARRGRASTGATAAEDPDRRPGGAGRRRHRPRRRHRQAAARRHRRVHGPDAEAARRDRGQAGRDHRRKRRSKPSGSSRSCAARSCSSASSSRRGPSATIRPRGQQHRALAQRARRAAGRG